MIPGKSAYDMTQEDFVQVFTEDAYCNDKGESLLDDMYFKLLLDLATRGRRWLEVCHLLREAGREFFGYSGKSRMY